MVEATDKTFDTLVTKSKDVVVVDFYADWCAPCRMLTPLLTKVTAEAGVKLVKVNADVNPETVDSFGVRYHTRSWHLAAGRARADSARGGSRGSRCPLAPFVQITALPTVISFRHGKPLDKFTGFRDGAFVRSFVDRSKSAAHHH